MHTGRRTVRFEETLDKDSKVSKKSGKAGLYSTGVRTSTPSDNKVRKLFAVGVLHISLLNITVGAFKVLPLGSYAPMPAISLPFKTILDLVLRNGLQELPSCYSCCHQCHQNAYLSIFPLPSGTEKVTGG
jgi:hypothetical protein